MQHAPTCCTNYVTLWLSAPLCAQSHLAPPHKVLLPRLTSPAHATDSFPAFPHISRFSSLSVFHVVPRLNAFQCIFVASKLVFWETISNTFDKMSLFLCRNRRENVRRKCLTVITQNYSNGCHRQIATICVFSEKCKILNGELKRGKGRRESALQEIHRNCRKIESQTLVST